MEGINLANKRAVICGLPGSGKTELNKSLARSIDDHIIYDPINDYIGFNRYTPTDRHSKQELSEFILEVVIPRKVAFFSVDEANKYIEPKPTPLPVGIADLNDLSRHFGVAWTLICRRPTQMHSDVLELAHYLFLFRLPGRLDVKLLNATWSGMGDVCAGLPDFHFIVYEQGRGYYIHNPIKI